MQFRPRPEHISIYVSGETWKQFTSICERELQMTSSMVLTALLLDFLERWAEEKRLSKSKSGSSSSSNVE